MPAKPSRSPVPAWLQLVRPPNLFTVPGDPLVGYLFTNAGIFDWSAVAAVGSSLLLYSAGLVLNDLADLEEDRGERPGRPLPSGAVSVRGAWLLAIGLALAGLGAAALTGSQRAFFTAVALLVTVALYDFLLKRWVVIGAVSMGLCRSLSVLVGAFSGPIAGLYPLKPQVQAFAVVVGAFIAAVTNLARHETKPTVPTSAKALPAVVMLAGCLLGGWYALGAPERHWAGLFLLAAMAGAGWLAAQMFEERKVALPPLIGWHIRLLLVLQGAGAYLADPYLWGPILAILLVGLVWASARVSRWFYAS